MRELTHDEVNVINGGDFSVTVNYSTSCANGMAGGLVGTIATSGPVAAAAVFWSGAIAGGCFSGGLSFSFS